MINLDHLSRATAGDDALQLELLNLFRQQLESAAERLDPDASSPGDFDFILHRLRGAAEAVGATPLAAEIARIETPFGGVAGAARPPSAGLRESLRATLASVDDLIAAHGRRGLAKDGESG